MKTYTSDEFAGYLEGDSKQLWIGMDKSARGEWLKMADDDGIEEALRAWADYCKA